jgi:tripartite ATP-independent transporter DctM subunit
MLLIWTFISLIVMLLIGFPIYLSLIGASILYVLLNPGLSMMLVIQKVISAPNSFPLLAVPFFIFAGQMMNTGGVTKRIFRFAENLVGHFRGGLGYVNVLASMIFAGMSGSALADAGGLGLVEIKAMRDAGYNDDFAIGVTAASSLIGPIIPPSIPFVIFGAMANVSIGGLFVGGLIPGVLMGLTLSIMIFIIAKRRDYPVSARRASLRELLISFKDSILAILTPVIIIGGIWLGFFTPTEAAFVSIIYALIVITFAYREFNVRDLPKLIIETIRMVAPSIMIVAGAAIFAWVLSYEKVDKAFMSLLFGLTTNKYVILLIMNVLLILIGCFVDIVAAIMIMLPILLPITTIIGVHPVQLGVIMVLNLMIGLLTPPVGMVLYILASMTKKPFGEIVKMVIPWLIPLVIALLCITFIPELVLFLPNLLGMAE